MLDMNEDQASLIEALKKLVKMADNAKFGLDDDIMMLNPASLDASCSESLFDDEDLRRLHDLITTQHLSQIRIPADVGSVDQPTSTPLETNLAYHGEPHKAPQISRVSPHEAVLQVPPQIVGQFGKVFVEIVALMMSPQWVFSILQIGQMSCYHGLSVVCY